MDHRNIVLLDTHPVILSTVGANYRIAEDWAKDEVEIGRILDASEHPLFLVSDIRDLALSFDDMIVSASMGSRGKTAMWHHPKIRGVYFVTDNKLVKMAAAGMKNPAFGNLDVRVFATVEEALADVERVMAAG